MPRVLIVDDHIEMAETLAEGLADRGFDALAIRDGASALGELERGNVDAIVTDLRMRPMDGLELLDRARRTRADVPVLVMTAFGGVESEAAVIARGADQFLTKPFKLDELVCVLRLALDRRG